MISTYNFPTQDKLGWTQGSYYQTIVVYEHYVLRINHAEQQLAAVAPLLCAGITTYSPLRHWQARPGKKVGIVGIGGLGHMGTDVVAFNTSDTKREAARALGADEVVVSHNAEKMQAYAKSFYLIVNTAAAPHDLDAFVTLLKRDGTMTLVSAPPSTHPSPSVMNLIGKRRAIASSLIGGNALATVVAAPMGSFLGAIIGWRGAFL